MDDEEESTKDSMTPNSEEVGFIKAKSFIPDVPAGALGIPKWSEYEKRYAGWKKMVKIRVHNETGKEISPEEEHELIEKSLLKDEDDWDCYLEDEEDEKLILWRAHLDDKVRSEGINHEMQSWFEKKVTHKIPSWKEKLEEKEKEEKK